MCVIMLVNGDVRPTEEMVRSAFAANGDGAGIAWREGEDEDCEVVWRKGLMKVDEILELCEQAPMPYVAHFRIASVGGVRKSLTHPFPIEEDGSLDLDGRTKGSVLFHNGHWSAWADKALDAAISTGFHIPVGAWSDTRAIAWMTYIYGPGFMELLTTQKGVILSPSNINVFAGNGWDKVNGVWCSNDFFVKRKVYTASAPSYGNRMCNVGRCTKYVSNPNDRACEDCKKLLAKSAEDIIGAADNKPTGGSAAVVPFGPDTMITLKAAEVMHRKGTISKSLLKKIRQAHQQMAGTGRKAERGRKSLIEHTQVALQLAASLGGPLR